MPKVGIYGAAGYAGLELIKLIQRHPQFDLSFAVSDSFMGEQYEGVEFVPLKSVDPAQVELVFLCTPHKASAPLAKAAHEAGAKVVDLSADLRLKSPETYAQWYGDTHPHPEMLPTIYGLPELNRAQIVGETLIANPGCYPTTSLLGIAPLAKADAIAGTIIIDAKSGVSGAGRKPKLGTHFVEVFGDFKPYNIGHVHRHVGEIEQELRQLNPAIGQVIFSPHLLPIDRGILATIYITLKDGWSLSQVRDLYDDLYQNEPLVDLLPDGQIAKISDVARQNRAIISLHAGVGDTMIVVAALDNLLKGASSQAVQNANLIFDLPETMGLL